MYFFYSAFLFVYFLALLPATAYSVWKHGKPVGSLRERLGWLPCGVSCQRQRSIWIHAVSVGEVLSVRPLILVLRKTYPEYRLVMSTTTVTGQRVARKFGDELDAVFYAPFDFSPIVARTLDCVSPELLLIVDTEIWPNLFRGCRRRGVRVIIVNGRMSDRSFRGYRLVRRFMQRVLDDVDCICVQTERWARRFIDIGADSARVTVTGNLKYDAVSTPTRDISHHDGDQVIILFSFARSRVVLIAASTLQGEEEPVLRAFNRVRKTDPDALLIVAPRHPERFNEALECAKAFGCRVQFRSTMLSGIVPDATVLVLDTIGELGRLFQIASVVFVGGSIVAAGGHNLLEPAAFGKAIVVGPHMENFLEVTAQFLNKRAVVQVQTADELEDVLVDLMSDGVQRANLGAAAGALVEAHCGATSRCIDVISEYIESRPNRSCITEAHSKL